MLDVRVVVVVVIICDGSEIKSIFFRSRGSVGLSPRPRKLLGYFRQFPLFPNDAFALPPVPRQMLIEVFLLPKCHEARRAGKRILAINARHSFYGSHSRIDRQSLMREFSCEGNELSKNIDFEKDIFGGFAPRKKTGTSVKYILIRYIRRT